MPEKRTPKKQRLDIRVIELGLFTTRQSAQAAIMDGGVLVDGQKITKPGTSISEWSNVEIAPGWGAPKYASRGGFKLEKALAVFQVDPSDRICLDIGASTGGFTDCLLQHGARLVYAVDVGYGQLDWKLRNDPRVVVHEKVNARTLTAQELYGSSGTAERASLAVIDVSFISVLKVLPAVILLLSDGAEIISLLKPQFEAGRKQVSKGGVVRDADVHIEVVTSIWQQARQLGLNPKSLTHSPIKGPAGNIEFLVHWNFETDSNQIDVSSVVFEAHNTLGGTQS